MKKAIARIQALLWSFPEWLITYFPGPVGRRARYFFWKTRMAHVGPGVTFGVGIQVANPSYITIGENSWIDNYVTMLAGPPSAAPHIYRKPNPFFLAEEGELRIGRDCHIAPYVLLQAHGGLSVGVESGIASGCKLYSLSHHYRDLSGTGNPRKLYKYSPMVPVDDQALICSAVVMQDRTALGVNSVLLPGAAIREGAWVGVLSLVRGEVPPYTLVAGNPAVHLKDLNGDE